MIANNIFYPTCIGKYYVVITVYPNLPSYLAPYKGEW
jgi:hypothetical protein